VFKYAVTPPSLSVRRYEGSTSNHVKLLGGAVNNLTLEFDAQEDGGVVTFSAELLGKFPTKAATAPSFTNPSDKPFAAWTAQVTKNSSTYSYLLSARIAIANNVELVKAGVNVADPSELVFGDHVVEGELLFMFADYTEYDAWVANTASDWQIKFEGDTISGTNKYSLIIDASNVVYTTYTPTTVGQFQAARVPFRALYSSADSSCVMLTVINTTSSY